MEMFLAEFDGVGRALFTSLDAAQDWCDRRAEGRWPGCDVEWPEEPREAAGSGPGQMGQIWYEQRWATDRRPDPIARLGTVVSLVADAETAQTSV